MLVRKEEIELEFSNYIETPPIRPAQMLGQASSGDSVTIESWRQQWIDQVVANHKKFGNFADKGIGKLFGTHKYKPAIIAGSGPSLKHNADMLKKRGGIPLVSCLHNYHFLEDKGITPELYVTLDAGEITISEVSEGGSKSEQYYWDSTKDKKLAAFIGTHPKLLEKWQGEILFYNAPVPDSKYLEAIKEVGVFSTYVSNGGNVLGACMYIAKAILGCNPIAFIGADFSFGNKKFHAWDSKYDANIGNVIRVTDIFGNKGMTWASYYNFKNWFDYIACTIPGIYINCTEGGIFGAFPEGNIMAVKQMRLQDFLYMYELSESVRSNSETPEIDDRKILF